MDALAAKDDIQGELVARFEKYLQLAASYRRGAFVAEQAAKHVRSPAPSERLKAVGTVLLIEVPWRFFSLARWLTSCGGTRTFQGLELQPKTLDCKLTQ